MGRKRKSDENVPKGRGRKAKKQSEPIFSKGNSGKETITDTVIFM